MMQRLGLGELGMIIALVLLTAQGCQRADKPSVRDSVVQITTKNGGGTGFFIKGPDGRSYIVTAFHVIENGGSVNVSRHMSVGPSERYIESYPETRVVAYDREADVAILEARNVPSSKMPPLALAEPVVDEAIDSYGFPDSALTQGALGLTLKEGRLSHIVDFPVIDRRTNRLVKAHAVKALIVSSALEPGFSGGPTVNRNGAVIGMNVQKDKAHQAQNGAVHASVISALLAKIAAPSAPKPSEVAALLTDLQSKFLELPVADRLNVAESDVLSLAELPTLRSYSDRLRWSKDSAPLQLGLSLMPGRALETSTSSELQSELNDCTKESSALRRLLSGLKSVEPSTHCGELPVRPLAWDLVAATLQWDGKPREYNVTQVDEIDPVAKRYTAKVRVSADSAQLLTVHMVRDGAILKLRVFNDEEVPFALESASTWHASDLVGTWSASRRFVQSQLPADPAGTALGSSETLSIAIGNDGSAKINHNVRSEKRAPSGKHWSCNNLEIMTSDLHQEFTGTFKNGVIRSQQATQDQSARPGCAPGCDWCGGYTRDMAGFFKRLGDKLIMYRYDGTQFEQKEFVRSSGSS